MDKEMKMYPLSYIQQQFWIENQMRPQNPAYNIASVFKISGDLDINALEKALNIIIQRHSIFRTSFEIIDGEPKQIEHSSCRIKNEIYEEKDINKTNQIVVDFIKHPFDLSHLPLIRISTIKQSSTRYTIVIVAHHIIFDLKTKDLFAEELAYYYSIVIHGKIGMLDYSYKEYSEYSIWQENWIGSNEYSVMVSNWQTLLKNKVQRLDFPIITNKRPLYLSGHGDSSSFTIKPERFNRLKEFSRKCNTNSYLTLLTIYAILLYRYSHQENITIGVPLTNRRKDEYKNVMGCFVNILPITVCLNDKMSYVEVLRQIRIAMLDAHRNQEVPYVLIDRTIKPFIHFDKNTPIIQVGFTNEHPMRLALEGLEVKSIHVHSGGAQLELFLTWWEDEGTLYGYLEYDQDFFAPNYIDQVVNNFLILLDNVIDRADGTICGIPILSQSEKELILKTWNSTKAFIPENEWVHTLFEKQVSRTPDCVAACFGKESITYSELNRYANHLSYDIQKISNGKNILIGVCIDRSIHMLAAILGILKSGGAYVPIDPDFPKERIHYMIEHSELELIVSENKHIPFLNQFNTRIMTMDSAWENKSEFHDKNLDNLKSQNDLAYVIYTSGSTGTPKGVKVHHRAVVNFLLSMIEKPGISSNDILLAVTTLSFDIAVLELFGPLIAGGKIVIADRNSAIDGTALKETIEKFDVTVMQATPITWRLLIDAGWEGRPEFKILCGGEALDIELSNELTKRSENTWNMYGPTETTVWSTCYKLYKNCNVLVGSPIANTQIYILDNQLEPVPVGVLGDLYIGGEGVTQGYLKQDELTDKQFIKDPFDKQSSQKIYKTGDLARYLPDGQIDIHGRSDFQIKIRGYRIETEEIESILCLYPSIKQAVVTVVEMNPGDIRLVAYYILKKNLADPEIHELRSFVTQHLPDYMIPSYFILMREFPLTPNGKINRKALPKPEPNRIDLGSNFAPPTNETERILTEIWCEILNLDFVSIHDKFFDIGGTSLLAIYTLNKIKKQFNISISIVILFQYPTIKSFAEFLNSKSTSSFNGSKERANLRKEALRRVRSKSNR